MDKLKKLRDRIDWLDRQIASLLNERMCASDQVGKIKKLSQQEVIDPFREGDVLNQVEHVIQHPVLKANIANIYREIMQESRIAQQFFQYSSQPFRRIGIVGVGLIGGSICQGLKTKDASIQMSILKHPSEDVSLAEAGGWVDHVCSTLEELIEQSELIILASPIPTIIDLAKAIKARASHPLIVIDMASVKGEIVKAFEELSCEIVEYLSTHPMAGKETKGFANSEATLFVNKPWVVVPHQKNKTQCIQRVEELILFLGSKPLHLEATLHDQRAALISHLPMVLAKAYLDFVHTIDPESLMMAGPGFQSFVRLAQGNHELREDISRYNHHRIQDYLEQWKGELR